MNTVVVLEQQQNSEGVRMSLSCKITHQSAWSTHLTFFNGMGWKWILPSIYLRNRHKGTQVTQQISPPRRGESGDTTGNVLNLYIIYGGLNLMVKQGKE